MRDCNLISLSNVHKIRKRPGTSHKILSFVLVWLLSCYHIHHPWHILFTWYTALYPLVTYLKISNAMLMVEDWIIILSIGPSLNQSCADVSCFSGYVKITWQWRAFLLASKTSCHCILCYCTKPKGSSYTWKVNHYCLLTSHDSTVITQSQNVYL